MSVLTAGLIGALIGLIALDVWEHSTQGWKQYALTDKEWHKLQHHLQQMPKDREVY